MDFRRTIQTSLDALLVYAFILRHMKIHMLLFFVIEYYSLKCMIWMFNKDTKLHHKQSNTEIVFLKREIVADYL